MRWLFLLSSLVVGFQTSPIWAQEVDEESWKGTGLDLAQFQQDILRHCEDGPEQFAVCVRAMNSLGELLPSPMILTFGGFPRVLIGHTAGVETELPGRGAIRFLKTTWLKKLARPFHPEEKSGRWPGRRAEILRELFAHSIEAAKKNPEILFFDFQVWFREWFFKALKKKNETGSGPEALIAHVYNAAFSASPDPYQQITPVAVYEESVSTDHEEYFGVGFHSFRMRHGIFVSAIYPGSPAEKAGIQVGDRLVSVNGKRVGIFSPQQLTGQIRGPKGTQVTLGVRRDGKTLLIPVFRGPVRSDNVRGRLLERDGKRYAWIRVLSFSSLDTASDLKALVVAFQKQGAEKFILDLRNNPGGSINQAVEVASVFLGEKKIVSTHPIDAGFVRNYYGTLWQPVSAKEPLVVLVNANSASASELVAGSLQSYRRAWIVGDRTFGKGLVQNYQYFAPERFDDRILYKSTTDVFRLPSGRTPHFYGIIPDFEVTRFPNGEPIQKAFFREMDMYEGALPRMEQFGVSKWTQPREEQVKKIEQCRKKTGSADRLWKKREDDGSGVFDFQVFSAVDILNCVDRLE